MNFGFEYFCGANVLVRIGDMPLLEAAGVSLSIQETKRPIYGYSSRFFDAVARGQVLVQGQIVINYVHQDYLYHAIRAGLGLATTQAEPITLPDVDIQDYMSSIGGDREMDAKFIEALKQQFWTQGNVSKSGYKALNDTRNPHDNFSGINLKITFGDQDLTLNSAGKTGFLVSNLHFMGRSSVINISEEAIIEAYPFIARDLHSLRPSPYVSSSGRDPGDPSFGETIEIGSIE